MDNLGTEVGQKMRNAIKAKLIELSSSSSSGYVDDELPEYVMIMVANKRSKQQMIDDLTLFLNENTEEFVNWLHQVLQKLQEVTLPASVAQKVLKKKTNENDGHTKKEKRDKDKKKKIKSKSSETEPIPSITDVFADHLIQKAKKTMDIEKLPLKKEEKKSSNANGNGSETHEKTDNFDIPTITEIAENAVEEVSRRKELKELEEIQRKINQAKKQLKELATDESEDEDFLNLRDEDDDFDSNLPNENRGTQAGNTVIARKKQGEVPRAAPPKHAPIVFDLNELSRSETEKRSQVPRKPISERLGNKNVISLSANRKVEKEIYIPAHKRRAMESNSNIQPPPKKRPERIIPPKIKSNNEHLTRNRVGSHVIVVPPRPEYDEDEIEVPINSVVKVKPRPVIPVNRQACKNLLLRAVAEAQRSTAVVPKIRSETRSKSPVGRSRPLELYTKSFRQSKNKELQVKENFVIQINRVDENEDEYVPEPMSDRCDSDGADEIIYIPKYVEAITVSDDEELITRNEVLLSMQKKKEDTQFVVTLDGAVNRPLSKSLDKNLTKRDMQTRSDRANNRSDRNETLKARIPVKQRLGFAKSRYESPKSFEVGQSVKKLIIQNDSEDDEINEKRSEKRSQTRSRTRSRSPNKKTFVTKETRENSDKSIENNEKSPENKKEIDIDELKESELKESIVDKNRSLKRKLCESSSKYENLPPLSLVASNYTDSSVTGRINERCKYYPSCGKGDACEYVHPSTNCKAFPNCKFADKCLFIHPKCKFDLTCVRLNCNYSHTSATGTAPPLSSHVVPVQNYKSIKPVALPPLCKFYPSCSNTLCNFYHPKLCRFGKNCNNKIECNFYHYDIELPSMSKLKWVAANSG